MLLRIQHETKLTYTEPVSETVFEVRMAPPSDEDQTNLGYHLRTTPSVPVTIYGDGFGNRVDLFNILTPYQELVIRATSIVRTHRAATPAARLAGIAFEPEHDEFRSESTLEYLQPSPLVRKSPALDEFLAGLPRGGCHLTAVVGQLTDAVRGRLVYEKKVTTARTPVGEALRLGRGVCQDFAHLFLGGCRGIGLPARYVSGYIHQPGEVATHAWCQVWAGRNGWVDVDPTHGTFPGDDHVKIAIGRDYSDVPPNRGVWKGRARETIAVSVKVEPLERVPAEWTEWATSEAPWSSATWLQSQRQSQRMKLGSQSGYRQQQGQQQQADQAEP
ncbi:MAG TPA: transglutaminase family protein [Isosphaeraceae bacterium]|nr:transglutaminase family protein [Isosphaeraceae bacterium]